MRIYDGKNGNLTAAAESLVFNCAGLGLTGIDVRGTFTATLVPEGTIDGTNWFTLTINPQAGGAGVTSITAAGTWFVQTAGISQVRLRCSSYTSGTMTVTVLGSADPGTSNNVTVTADTEFPAAAALADNTANPTTTLVGSCTMAFDGTTWDRVTNGAGTAATALRTTLASDDPAVVAVQIMDDWDESDRAKVNPIVGQAGIAAGAGAVGVTVPRVTLASDDPAVVALQLIDNAVSGAGFNITQVNGEAIDVGAGTEAAAIRVTLPTDGTGKVSAAQSGTWTEANSAAIAASLSVMDDWDNAASTGVKASGDIAHDAVDAGEPVKIGYKAYAFDGTAPQTDVAEADRVNAISDLSGIQYVQTAHPFHWDVSVDYASAQTNASIKAAPGASLKLYITDIMVSNGATAGNITLLDGSGGSVKFECYPGINGGVTFCPKTPIMLTANTALCITSTTVTTHSLTICGFTAA